jgi:hypothetical protein
MKKIKVLVPLLYFSALQLGQQFTQQNTTIPIEADRDSALGTFYSRFLKR